MYPLIVARQRLGKYVSAETNTGATIEAVLDAVRVVGTEFLILLRGTSDFIVLN
jgi:hypothetical protein